MYFVGSELCVYFLDKRVFLDHGLTFSFGRGQGVLGDKFCSFSVGDRVGRDVDEYCQTTFQTLFGNLVNCNMLTFVVVGQEWGPNFHFDLSQCGTKSDSEYRGKGL